MCDLNGKHNCPEHWNSAEDSADDTTPDQRAEYQRLLASPTATAMALIEARAEIEQLLQKTKRMKAQLVVLEGADDAIDKERAAHAATRLELETIKKPVLGLSETMREAYGDPMAKAIAAAESQIAALKVELAAMMKERDEARQEADAIGANEHRIAHELQNMTRSVRKQAAHHHRRQTKMAAERDAALAELSQVRAELDTRKVAMKRQADDLRAIQVALGSSATMPGDSTTLAKDVDAAVKRAEALSEENARLKREVDDEVALLCDWQKNFDNSQALRGRAVAALRAIDGCIAWSDTTQEWYLIGKLRTLPALREVRAILADATAIQAADAWRAQQEERADLAALIPFVRLAAVGCLTVQQQCEAYEALAKVDARRGGGR